VRRLVTAFRPFGPLWTILFALAIVATFGLGGGTGTSAASVALRTLLLSIVLTSLLVGVALEVWRSLRKT
jgi:hypothetical protein